MINKSQKNSPHCWKVWRDSGALARLDLPGAERFTEFLKQKLGGPITVNGPVIVDWSYNGEYAKRYVVKFNGETLGEYYTFGPKPGEE